MTFVTPRLPRLPTDQTQTLSATAMADGVITLLNAFLPQTADGRAPSARRQPTP